jgi:hypothetical protein
MELLFDDKVAVITGAGGGLGEQYAVAEEICNHGGGPSPDTHSVTSPKGTQALIATALHAWRRCDIVINNS